MPLVAAAVIGAAGSAYAANQAGKAADKSIAAQNAATQQQLAMQKQVYETSLKNQAPYLDAGTGALPGIQSQLGLTNAQDRAGYLAAYSDVGAEFQRLSSSPEGQAYLAQQGIKSAEDFAGLHYQTNGQGEGRTMGELPSAQDQLAQQVGTRDTYSRPGQTSLPGLPNVDPSQYQKSASYDYQQKEGIRQLNSGYAAKGMLQSGAAIKGVQDYAQNLADQDYQQWYNNQMGQYDRSFSSALAQNTMDNANFESDRTYGTSVYDADRNYLTGQNNTQTQNLFQLAGIGQNAAANTSSAGQNYANNSGNALQTQANALAAGYNQTAQANASAANNIAGIGQDRLAGYGTSGKSSSNVLTNKSKIDFKYMN